MTAKSIIEIDLKDASWKAFVLSYKAHQENLKKMPGQWGMIGNSIGKAGSSAAKLLAIYKNHANALKEANTMSSKMLLALKASDRVASSMVKGTLSIARNMKDATRSLLSWVSPLGLITGLLGAGGLFGMSRLAQNVSSGQVSAQRAGTTYGGAKAAGIAYGQMLGGEGGVQSMMEKFAREKESGGLAFQKLGMKPEEWKGRDTADIIAPFLKALQSLKGPEGVKKLAAEPFLPEGMDYNTLMQINATDLDAREKTYASDKKLLELSLRTQEAWANFDRQIQLSEGRFGNVFAKNLVTLTPSLGKLSNAFVGAFDKVMKSPVVGSAISGAAKGIDTMADYLTSKEFQSDLQRFLEELKKVGDAISNTAKFLNKWLGNDDSKYSVDNEVKVMREIRESQAREARHNVTHDAKVGSSYEIPGQRDATITVVSQDARTGEKMILGSHTVATVRPQ